MPSIWMLLDRCLDSSACLVESLISSRQTRALPSSLRPSPAAFLWVNAVEQGTEEGGGGLQSLQRRQPWTLSLPLTTEIAVLMLKQGLPLCLAALGPHIWAEKCLGVRQKL